MCSLNTATMSHAVSPVASMNSICFIISSITTQVVSVAILASSTFLDLFSQLPLLTISSRTGLSFRQLGIAVELNMHKELGVQNASCSLQFVVLIEPQYFLFVRWRSSLLTPQFKMMFRISVGRGATTVCLPSTKYLSFRPFFAKNKCKKNNRTSPPYTGAWFL